MAKTRKGNIFATCKETKVKSLKNATFITDQILICKQHLKWKRKRTSNSIEKWVSILNSQFMKITANGPYL